MTPIHNGQRLRSACAKPAAGLAVRPIESKENNRDRRAYLAGRADTTIMREGAVKGCKGAHIIEYK